MEEPAPLNDGELDAIIAKVQMASAQEFTQNVSQEEVEQVCLTTINLLKRQQTLVEITPPVVVCGNIHGQFTDLERIFEAHGFPPNKKYLFLGDFVDRGPRSLQTALLLLLYNARYPESFYVLRGHHECSRANQVYGFYTEIQRRFGDTNCEHIWMLFNQTFSWLPYVGLVGGRILCLHGGISPIMRSLDQLRTLRRGLLDPPNPSMELDILFADPEQGVRGSSELIWLSALISAFFLEPNFSAIENSSRCFPPPDTKGKIIWCLHDITGIRFATESLNTQRRKRNLTPIQPGLNSDSKKFNSVEANCGQSPQSQFWPLHSISSDTLDNSEIQVRLAHPSVTQLLSRLVRDVAPILRLLYNFGVQDVRPLKFSVIHDRRFHTVFLNGSIVGVTDDGAFVSVSFNASTNALYLASDGGRLCRPYIIVENGCPCLTKSQIEEVQEDGKTRLSSVLESLSMNIKFLAQTTHLEIEPFSLLGIVSGLIPYPHHNQSPRNTYQCAMGKQAMGTIGYNQQKKIDLLMYLLVFPQKPLVKTKTIELSNFEKLPAGQNSIVAVMSFSGYDIEDALVQNKASLDRGFGRCMVYRFAKGTARKRNCFCWGEDNAQTGAYQKIHAIDADMPFDQNGTVPDLIMKLHGRMAVGKLMELLSGCHAFTGDDMETDMLISGSTGQQMAAYVYFGPIYYQKLKQMLMDKLRLGGGRDIEQMAALPAVACASLTRTPLAAHLQRLRSAVQLVWERRGRRKGKE
uniref:DNA-directed RNA polymerase n=1 Tax=Globodera rostochiensis TaxID=31243 RepID=A0A914HK21_GLORO